MGFQGPVGRKFYATRGRKGLLDALSKHLTPLTAKQLHGIAGAGSCDLGTVHRSLRRFVLMGLVNEIIIGGDSRRYEMSDQGRHHHHVSCTSCGRVEDIPLCRVAPFTRYAEKEKGFEVHSHSFELFGFCPVCRRAKGRGETGSSSGRGSVSEFVPLFSSKRRGG